MLIGKDYDILQTAVVLKKTKLTMYWGGEKGFS